MKFSCIIFLFGVCLLTHPVTTRGGSGGPKEKHKHNHQHHKPKGRGEKLLNDDDLLHDREHLIEDSKNQLTREQIENMDPKEIEYHYFKLHDFDNNHKLDGLELLAALGHVHQSEEGSDGLDAEELLIVEEMIDEVLKDGDRNNDGYVNYGEYRLGRKHGKTAHN